MERALFLAGHKNRSFGPYQQVNWRKLNGSIHNKIIILSNFDNVKPFKPKVHFPDATILFVTECDKNFVHDWIYKEMFPNVMYLYLDSHPFNHDVLGRFECTAATENCTKYLTWPDFLFSPYYVFFSKREMVTLLKNMEPEPIKFTPAPIHISNE